MKKRSVTLSEDHNYSQMDSCNMKKKIRQDQLLETVTVADETMVSVLLDENLLYEVMKHVDARTLAAVGCVNKLFHRTAQDERLWELICTQHWAKIGSSNNDQFRAVVLALGGFRRLYSHYLWPLSKPSFSSDGLSLSSTVGSSSVWPCLPQQQQPRTVVSAKPAAAKNRWGKDEVQLSLSLLSIRFYEKMNSNYKK